MNKHIRVLVFTSAFLAMGFSMPGCPGQQAMQQQIDALQTANADLTKKVNGMSTKMDSVNAELAEIKRLLPSVANVVQTSADTLKNLNAAVSDIQTRMAAQSARPTKGAPPKKRGR